MPTLSTDFHLFCPPKIIFKSRESLVECFERFVDSAAFGVTARFLRLGGRVSVTDNLVFLDSDEEFLFLISEKVRYLLIESLAFCISTYIGSRERDVRFEVLSVDSSCVRYDRL